RPNLLRVLLQPLSYAEFVVQSKNRALQGAAFGPEKQSRSDAAGQSSVNTAGSGSVSTSSTDSEKPETEQQGPEKVPTEDQTKEESQSSESCIIPPHLLGSGNSIIVSPRQRGHPILKFVRNVLWEFGEVVPDCVFGRTTCSLFLRLVFVYMYGTRKKIYYTGLKIYLFLLQLSVFRVVSPSKCTQ
uniref:ERCC1-like central domain-containing protein n=2 Tax=Cyprinus carpio carpio TaxID=630221 RepID=A0A9J8CQC0_CYPCA